MSQPFDTTNIPIETLRSLLTVIRTGSITSAAAHLQLSQPAVTAQIKRLERLVGGPVLERSHLTERGETVARYARKIIASNDQLLTMLWGQPEILRLGVSPAMTTYRLHEIFKACDEIEDNIKLDIEPSKILEEKLDGGFLDVALIISHFPRKNPKVCWDEKFAWVVSKDFSLLPGKALPFLSYPDSTSHKLAMEVLERKQVPFNLIMTSRDLATHFSLCERGKGVMVFPERFVPDTLIKADWLPIIPNMCAGIYVADGFEPEYLDTAIGCIEKAFSTKH